VIGETVHHPADVGGPLLAQDIQRIGAGVAGVHDERFADLAGHLDMGTEFGLLMPFVFGPIVVIETGLTERHHARI